jgi:hypothetical protein
LAERQAEAEAARAAIDEGAEKFYAKIADAPLLQPPPPGWASPVDWLVARTQLEELAEHRGETVESLLDGIGVARLDDLQPSDLETLRGVV